MFFILSKLLAFLFSPLVWVFALLVSVLIVKDLRKKRKLLIIALVVFYVTSNSFIIDELMRKWEVTTADTYMDKSTYDVALVLGGMGRVDERQQRFDFSYAGDRLFQTLELYHRHKIKKIMISGGSASISKPNLREAIYVRKYLLQIGIPDTAIIIEPNSKNTRENALFSKHLLDSLKLNSSILLVTSGFHMRRAMGCFKKAGFENLTPYVTNRISGPRKFEWDHCFLPSVDAMNAWSILLHEVVGYGVYKLKGYV